LIPGLELEPASEARVWDAFQGWADHFRSQLAKGGVDWLVEKYASVIASVENRICGHGPGGRRQTGDAWQSCCGMSYEYRNDLSVRDAIQMIIERAPAAATVSLRAETATLDARLHILYSHRPERVGRWWRDGLPDGVIE